MVAKRDADSESGKALRKDETEKAALDQVLAGRDLIELFTPRRRVTALLDELRRNPSTRTILDGRPSAGDESGADHARDQRKESVASQQLRTAPTEHASRVLAMVVDYANGMTQQEIARKHGLHVQTVRKRLDETGVVTRARSCGLTEADLGEARSLLAAGISAREIGRRLGVAHTTLLRSIRRSDAALFEKSTNAHHKIPKSTA